MPTIPTLDSTTTNDNALGPQPDAASAVKIYSRDPRCEKCHAPLGASAAPVCRNCGWYSAAGTFIEIDRTWEGVEENDAPAASGFAALPRWARLMIVTALAVIVQSIAVRLLTPDGSAIRSAWSGVQFVAGAVGFLGCQIAGFFILLREDATVTVLDVILKPIKIIEALFRGLPRRFWIVNSGVNGFVALLAAVLIIGSVPYHLLWSWHVDYRSTQNLESAVGQEGAGGRKKTAKEEEKREVIRCLVIGYTISDEGNIQSVLVARERNGRLQYVGGVQPVGEDAQLYELHEQLVAATRSTPVMHMDFTAQWVEPKYSVEISYAFEQENHALTDTRWEGDVRELRLNE